MLNKIERTLVKAESIVAALSLFLLLALSIFQIITRNFFNFGYSEIEIINRNLLVLCGSMGAVIATAKLRHIKIDVLTAFMEKHHVTTICCPIALFSAFICAVMSYYAGIFVLDEWQYAPSNERWALPFTLTYPVGFALLSIHFFLNCFTKEES